MTPERVKEVVQAIRDNMADEGDLGELASHVEDQEVIIATQAALIKELQKP